MTETATEARAKLQRARAQIRTLRERGQQAARMTTQSAMAAAGGASAAVLDQHMPSLAGLDTKLVFGAGLTLVALTEMAGDWSDEVLALGNGMLAVTTYEMTRGALAVGAGGG